MDPQHNSIETAKEYLVTRGINPSFQRLKIYEYLAKTAAHPTVDMIFTELAKEIPTLSKTTIYNTLNLFQNNGIVSGLTIDANELRYDLDTRVHAHFKCFECGSIIDIPVEPSYTDMVMAEEHEIKERHIYLKGTCKNCLKSI